MRAACEAFNDAIPHSPNRVMLAGSADRIDTYVGSTAAMRMTANQVGGADVSIRIVVPVAVEKDRMLRK